MRMSSKSGRLVAVTMSLWCISVLVALTAADTSCHPEDPSVMGSAFIQRQLKRNITTFPALVEVGIMGAADCSADDAQCKLVHQCFADADASAERQAKEKGALGIVSGIGNAVADVVSLGAGCGSSLIQMNRSIGPMNPVCAVAAAAGGMIDAVNAGADMAHELENIGSENCAQSAARATMNGIHALKNQMEAQTTFLDDKISASTAAIKNALQAEADKAGTERTKIQGSIDELRSVTDSTRKELNAKLSKSLEQGAAGQALMREVESRLDSRMMSISSGMETLAAKLDRLMSKVLETMEAIEMTRYSQHAVTFSAAVAATSGAFDDLVHVLQEIQKHNADVPLGDSSSDNEEIEDGLERWLQDSHSLKISARNNMHDAWVRARDNFAHAVSAIVEGDLLNLHFMMQLKVEAETIMQLASDEGGSASSVFNDGLITGLSEHLLEDPMLPVLIAMTARVAAVGEMLVIAFPNDKQAVLKPLLDATSKLSSYASDMYTRLGDAEYLNQIFEVLMPAIFPISEDCQSAAFKAGYPNTDTMTQWNTNLIASKPSRLLMNADSADVFFECKGRPTVISNQGGHQKFNFFPPENTDSLYGTAEMEKACNAGLTVTVLCDTDYLTANGENSFDVVCDCNRVQDQGRAGGGDPYYKWSCALSLMCYLSPSANPNLFAKASSPAVIVPTAGLVPGGFFSMFPEFLLDTKKMLQQMTGSSCSTSVRLFYASTGSNGEYRNTWEGWYSEGPTSSAGQDGKYAEYDSAKLCTVRFEDSSGEFAEYELSEAYQGKTLMEIVKECMGSSRLNTHSYEWQHGHCSVGTLTQGQVNSVEPLSETLRIGVGDGSADSHDWALFYPLLGSGKGDYNGYNVWGFGTEHETNNGAINREVWIDATIE